MLVIALFLLASAAFAQNGGSVMGKVSDDDGVAVAKAKIQAKNAATGATSKLFAGLVEKDASREAGALIAKLKPGPECDENERQGRCGDRAGCYGRPRHGCLRVHDRGRGPQIGFH